MTQSDWSQKFPRMTPVKKGPTMFRVNGCGVALYGKRDLDAETGAYVATWCVALLFIPILALRAYRVAKAPKGWYFLGREPLSTLARAWNLAIVLSVAATFGIVQYNNYLTTPGHHEAVLMQTAKSLVGQGHLAKAAGIYQSLAVAGGEESIAAAEAVKGLLDTQCPSAPLSECSGVFAAAAEIARKTTGLAGPDVASAGQKIVDARGDTDARSALAILDAVRPLVIDTSAIDNRRLALLNKWAAAEPNNLDAIVPLAAIHLERNELDAARKLLLPMKAQLGDGEGARVLGLVLARQGENDGAYALLWPYVKGRLDNLHVAEKALDDAAGRVSDRAIKTLQNNQAPKSFYDQYNAVSADQQRAMVRQYVVDQRKHDPQYVAAEDNLEAHTHVVPVALELGIVMLQRAQAQADPVTRKAQLEAAQNVFLAIEGIAGESDEYRITLGQVYYWLGKPDEGRKLFDDYLASKNRASTNLLEVAYRLRSVGSDGDARSLAEEAYNKAQKDLERYAAAIFRADCNIDLDDEIAWLAKADPADAEVKATLAEATGNKALQDGRTDDAVAQFRAAADAYDALPRSSGSLNEAALAYYGIFCAIGDRASFDRCVDSFQQAVDLDPTNTTLLYNAGVTLLDGALADVIGKEIDLNALHDSGDVGLLGYLYHDSASRQAVVDRVRNHPGVARALTFLDKVMVLAPKRADGYSVAYGVDSFTRDQAALEALDQRINAAAPDTAEQTAYTREYLKGVHDQEQAAQLTSSIKHYQRVAQEQRTISPLTAAIAMDDEVARLMSLDQMGKDVDADQVLSLAQDAQALSPGSATTTALLAAHFFHAASDLAKADPAFAAFRSMYRRTLSADDLVAFIASEPGPFQSELLQNVEVQLAIGLMKQQDASFPDNRSPQEWALLKNVDPPAADQAAKIILASPRGAIEQSIAALLSPASTSSALQRFWSLQIQNKPDEAKAALQKLSDLGIPMPVPQ
jgi:hypothetical protein